MQLKLFIKEAKGLIDADFFKKSDPYVRTSILDNKGNSLCKSSKSKVIRNNLNPVTILFSASLLNYLLNVLQKIWNQLFEFEVPENSSMLCFKLYDRDFIGKDDCLGVTYYSLSNYKGEAVDLELPVYASEYGQKHGEIYFILSGDFSIENVWNLEKEIKVLQYNLHLFGAAGSLVDKLSFGKTDIEFEDEQRLEQLLKSIKKTNPDCLSLVELWDGNFASKVVDTLKEEYPYSYNHKSWPEVIPKVKPLGNGLLFLSKFELSDQQYIPYNDLTGSDKYSQKGFVCSTLHLSENNRATIFITHTQAAYSYDPNNPDYNEPDRQKNIDQLINGMQFAQSKYNHPIFAMGDFNVLAETEEYSKMCHNFKTSIGATDSWDIKQFGPGVTYDCGTFNEESVYVEGNTLIPIFAPGDCCLDTDGKKLEKCLVGTPAHQRIDYMFHTTEGTNCKIEVLEGLTDPKNLEEAILKDSFGDKYLYKSTERQRPMDVSDHFPLLMKFQFKPNQ